MWQRSKEEVERLGLVKWFLAAEAGINDPCPLLAIGTYIIATAQLGFMSARRKNK